MFKNMGIALIGVTFVLGGLMIYERRKHTRINDKKNKEFWDREDHSNTVRRKDITFLPYIDIPLADLPMDPSADEEIAEYQDTIRTLSGQRILNLSEYTNTDLKEAYGIANLSQLSEYDENYTTLVNTLARWGARLMDLGERDDAVTVLEYGIKLGTDISRNYYLLAQEYKRRETPERIDGLIETAEGLTTTLLKDSIVQKLKDIRDDHLLPGN